MNGENIAPENAFRRPDLSGLIVGPEGAEPLPEPAPVPGAADVNDSEAGNLAFLVSDRISRNPGIRLMLEPERDEAAMAELADRISRRLEELSMRLGDEHADHMLDQNFC